MRGNTIIISPFCERFKPEDFDFAFIRPYQMLSAFNLMPLTGKSFFARSQKLERRN